MANDKDRLFEKIYFMWKGEGEKRNQSISFSPRRLSIFSKGLREGSASATAPMWRSTTNGLGASANQLKRSRW